MYGADMGSLEVLAARDNNAPHPNAGLEWESVWFMSGDQGNDWKKGVVGLSDRFGEFVKFRFIATTGNGYRSDIAVDKIHVERIFTTSTVITQNITYQDPISTCGGLEIDKDKTLTVKSHLTVDRDDEIKLDQNSTIKLDEHGLIRFDYPFKVSY